MTLTVWPYIKNQGIWTIPDQVIIGVWDKMCELDRVKTTWWDASIVTQEDFIKFMQDPYIFPTIIVDRDEVRFKVFAWLSDFNDGVARAHFCYLDKYDFDVGKMMVNFWQKLGTLNVIIGTIPESYKAALKFVERLGFEIIGTIPDICNMVYLNRREGGVVSYYLMEE